MRVTRAGLGAFAFSLAAAALPVGRAHAEELQFVDAWPGVAFDKPVCVAAAPDGSDRMFVAQRGGQVLLLQKYRGTGAASQPQTVVDLSSSIPAGKVEDSQTGLATVVCHPDFKSNGRLFLFVGTCSPDGSAARVEIVEVRMTGDAAGPRRTVLSVPIDGPNHYGGGLAFGRDGMLYVGIGAPPKEPEGQALSQDVRSMQGKILRISPDPTAGAGYGVPSGNAFANGGRPEIFAVGLRNPFRISFDSSGNLWGGDPGEKAREEINVIPPGGNLGWPLKEGSQPHKRVAAATPQLVDPVYEYGREMGKCAIGGIAYRGQRCPSLAGTYVFSDYMLGKVMLLTISGGRGSNPRVFAEVQNIASVNEDAQGELYFSQLDDNRILTLVPKP